LPTYSRSYGPALTNPVWIAVNMLMRMVGAGLETQFAFRGTIQEESHRGDLIVADRGGVHRRLHVEQRLRSVELLGGGVRAQPEAARHFGTGFRKS
jgi:hypothetical protein